MKTSLNHVDNNYALEMVCSNTYQNKNLHKLILYSRVNTVFLIITFITCNPLRGIWKFPSRITVLKLHSLKN